MTKYIVFIDDSYDPAPIFVCDNHTDVQSAVLELMDEHDRSIEDIQVYELGRKGQTSRSINVNFGDPI